jgi:hypothetical protein
MANALTAPVLEVVIAVIKIVTAIILTATIEIGATKTGAGQTKTETAPASGTANTEMMTSIETERTEIGMIVITGIDTAHLGTIVASETTTVAETRTVTATTVVKKGGARTPKTVHLKENAAKRIARVLQVKQGVRGGINRGILTGGNATGTQMEEEVILGKGKGTGAFRK